MQESRRAVGRTATLVIRVVNFELLRDLLGGSTWVRTLEGRMAQES